MNKNQKGFAPILILAVITIVAVAGYFLFTKNGKYTTTTTTNQSYSAIQSDSDLSKASNDLDGSDTTQVDTELNQLSADASAF